MVLSVVYVCRDGVMGTTLALESLVLLWSFGHIVVSGSFHRLSSSC